MGEIRSVPCADREADGCFVADSLGAALSWERGGREHKGHGVM